MESRKSANHKLWNVKHGFQQDNIYGVIMPGQRIKIIMLNAPY